MRVLGIETSCDETAAAVVKHDRNGCGYILSNIVRSQINEHAPYGGVVPEIAARAHVEVLDSLIKKALDEARVSLEDIDLIAATSGPGLIGGLLVGLMTAKAMALATDKPFIAVNHLEGHALTARLTNQIDFPYLLLLISGGHTQMILVRGLGKYDRLGTTIDDALGEAFDKTARLLGMPYPGGSKVEIAARNGNPERVVLPKLSKRVRCSDFSFSGLKTAVRHAVERLVPLQKQDIADVCSAFQSVVTDILADRVEFSLSQFREMFSDLEKPVFVVAGGVAANETIRHRLKQLCSIYGFLFVAPPPGLCTDNAAMIAWVGAEHRIWGKSSRLDIAPRARWPLDEPD